MNKETEDIRQVLDSLLAETTVLNVKLNVFSSMVLGVFDEILPKKNSEILYTNFVNAFETQMHEALENMDEILYDKSGQFLFHRKMDFHATILGLKQDPRYNGD